MSSSIFALLVIFYAISASAAPRSPKPKHDLKSYDMFLVRNPDYGFLSNVSIGTPAQSVVSFVDWTWTSQYVVSTVCAGNATDTSNCLSPQQSMFNQTSSSTYINESSIYPSESWYPNEFFPAPFTVDYASDIESIGPVSSRVVIQTSNIELGVFTQLTIPFSGIYGLMPTFKGDNASTQSPFYQQYLAHKWPAPYAAFTLCPAPTCPTGADAIQTLGGYSSQLSAKGLTWYPLTSVPTVNELDLTFSPGVFSYWAIALAGLSIGNEPQALNSSMESAGDGSPAAIFDHASRGRGLPLSANAYARLVQLTNATLIPTNSSLLTNPPNNGNQNFYQVDCDAINGFPTVDYTFVGSRNSWCVLPQNYVSVVGDQCILNVRTIGAGDFQLGNFGETFLKEKYIVFDFEKRRVGLANL